MQSSAKGNFEASIKRLEERMSRITVAGISGMASGERKNMALEMQALFNLYQARGPGKVTDDMHKNALLLRRLQEAEALHKNAMPQRRGFASALPQAASQPETDGTGKGSSGTGSGGADKSDEMEQLKTTMRGGVIDLGPDGFDNKVNRITMTRTMPMVWKKMETAFVDSLKFSHSFPQPEKLVAVILYGPPGTGKTSLARQLASVSDGTFLLVSASWIESKWTGEGARNVRALWSVARELVEFEGTTRAVVKKPCIVFFDEFDALFAGDSKAIQNEFLTQMDGLQSANRGVFFVAATNDFTNIPSNVMSRFTQALWVGLPGLDEHADQPNPGKLTWSGGHAVETVANYMLVNMLMYEMPNSVLGDMDLAGDLALAPTSANLIENVAVPMINASILQAKEMNQSADQVYSYRDLTSSLPMYDARSVANALNVEAWASNLAAADKTLSAADLETRTWLFDTATRFTAKDGEYDLTNLPHLHLLPSDDAKATQTRDSIVATYLAANASRIMYHEHLQKSDTTGWRKKGQDAGWWRNVRLRKNTEGALSVYDADTNTKIMDTTLPEIRQWLMPVAVTADQLRQLLVNPQRTNAYTYSSLLQYTRSGTKKTKL